MGEVIQKKGEILRGSLVHYGANGVTCHEDKFIGELGRHHRLDHYPHSREDFGRIDKHELADSVKASDGIAIIPPTAYMGPKI